MGLAHHGTVRCHEFRGTTGTKLDFMVDFGVEDVAHEGRLFWRFFVLQGMIINSLVDGHCAHIDGPLSQAFLMRQHSFRLQVMVRPWTERVEHMQVMLEEVGPFDIDGLAFGHHFVNQMVQVVDGLTLFELYRIFLVRLFTLELLIVFVRCSPEHFSLIETVASIWHQIRGKPHLRLLNPGNIVATNADKRCR